MKGLSKGLSKSLSKEEKEKKWHNSREQYKNLPVFEKTCYCNYNKILFWKVMT